jgi:hypothetical protein
VKRKAMMGKKGEIGGCDGFGKKIVAYVEGTLYP